MGPPLRGGPWLTANGPSPRSGHRRALVPIGGVPAIGQRFAIDYVKVNDKDSTYSGDRLKNESYYAEGNDALAVADGRVVVGKEDRKSTRLNSSHPEISYAVCCLQENI